MKCAPYNDEDEFETIFDGTSLLGWKMCGRGMFVLEERMMITKGGMGLAVVYEEKVFGLYS